MYVPLFCKSSFSFLEGASQPEELIEAASSLGLSSLALTDRDGVYGIVEAHVKAKETGVKLIVGSEVSIEDGSTVVLLATNRAGYGNLCQLLTIGRRRSEKGTSVVGWREVYEHASDVIALWGGERSLMTKEPDPFFVGHGLKEAFGDRLYAVAARHRRAEEPRQEARLRQRAGKLAIPVAAAHEVLYHTKARRPLQDVFTALRYKVKLSEAGSLLKPNDEHALKTQVAFKTLFEDDAAGVARTKEITARCTFSLDQLRYRYPAEKLPDGKTSSEWLRTLAFRGAAERYGGGIPLAVAEQVNKELALIEELDYGGYFLTMWEIVRFCREAGILCQGRGSAANSAVCYVLGITAVDPVALGLLFERFLSRERAEPPDIDLDIEHDRREEVIQHVYAKYGRTHAAMVANVIRYRVRSAVREVGKVLGVPETSLDRVSKILPAYGDVDPSAFAAAGLDPEHPTHQHLIQIASEVLDFPRHLSIHPGGFLLGHEPVGTIVPVENGTMEGRTVIQWDKDMIEELGLFKVDLLGLGALNQLHKGFDLLRAHKGLDLSLATLPKEDPATYDMVCAADTVGVFQIESRAQMAMLPRLKPRHYYDLVIEVSIVRPGPITGGMVHPYLKRRSGEEKVIYPHACLEPVLAKTLGVPLFQEQVIRLAMVAADYTPGEADQLRRDMAAWRKSGRIERHRDRLVSRMTAKGIEEEFALRVFEQIRGFGEYGFPESHAASFALIAYATAWMRKHHLDVFTCSLLNAQPMGFYMPATIIEDAKRHGLRVLPVDVTVSQWECTLEKGNSSQSTVDSNDSCRLGLRYVKGFHEAVAARLLEARAERPFVSIDDVVKRAKLDEGATARLAESGAFAAFEKNRRGALWAAKGSVRMSRVHSLPSDESPAAFKDLDLFESIGWDYDTMNLSAQGHPLEPLREGLRAQRLPEAGELRSMPDGRRVRYAGLVICRQRPGTASGVVFMTMEDETGFVNVVVWSKVYEKFRVLVKTASFLGVSGKLQVQDGVTHLIADSFWRPRIETSPAEIASRDFH
ncbi:MAG TPA: error-prone DNA polymerase [Candidatus Polarisedimenticolaceae bacterium]|nr:error-prone DNA polymerase [Candidatus Polarisedimenticolaceae bacterium]